MNEIIKKLEGLFKDINKFYSKYSYKLSIIDFNKWLLDNNSAFDFFNQEFNKREFNVEISEKYLSMTLKDYDLTIDQIEEYVKKLRVEKESAEKARKRRNKKNLIGTIISVLVISISLHVYNLYSERQEEIKEQLRLEKLAQEKQRDEKLSYFILDYVKQTDNRNIKQILTYWSDQPTRYWEINKNNEQGFISKSKIEESILKAFNLNSFSENEIKNISKTDEGVYVVDVLFKFKSKRTGVTKHIESTTVYKFNKEDKIVEEYSIGKPIIMYDSSKKVKKKYSNGTYEGNLINDKREGYGEYRWVSGNIYKGNWKDDKINGYGEYKWEGNIYKGNWKDAKKNGKGEITFYNGDVYNGNWMNDIREGFGEYRWVSGTIYKGNWKDNKRDGLGEKILPNGEKFKQEWDLDKLIKEENSNKYKYYELLDQLPKLEYGISEASFSYLNYSITDIDSLTYKKESWCYIDVFVWYKGRSTSVKLRGGAKKLAVCE